MSLIDSTYFRNDISLPVGTYSDIQQYIDKYEKEVLVNLLGYTNYTEMVAAYVESIKETNPVALPEKWDRLINGCTFSYNGYTVKWNGLINTEKESFIAYYVYCQYVKSHQTQITQTGGVQAKNENSTVVDGVAKYVDSWNKFVGLYGYLTQPLMGLSCSCLLFLQTFESDYSDMFPKLYGFTNQLGI